MKEKLPMADGRLPIERRDAAVLSGPIVNRKSQIVNRTAFTLIELLVVISIMALIAAFTLPVLTAVKRQQYVKVAGAELEQVKTALWNFHDKYGVYPPCNPRSPSLNQLYYELTGVTNATIQRTLVYLTLDGASSVELNTYTGNFNVGGAINCTKAGADEEASKARSFLPSLKQNRIGQLTIAGKNLNVLITSVRGPDANFKPLGVSDLNPFCYVYPGTNNPSSYDLWVDLKIGGKTNRVCNWSTRPLIL